MARDRWPSRTAFIYAAVGSAVGLGNIWRFPFLAHEHGGGAFLIPYLIAMLIAGIPLLILEFGLGQKIQRGAVDSFATIKRSLSGLGWWALFTGFIVVSYFVVVMAWALIYLFVSIGPQWAGDPQGYFFGNVLQLSDSVSTIGSLVPAVVIALFFCWVWIYFSIRNGVKSVSKVVMWTVPLPIILLVVLLVRAVTLDGWTTGIAAFLKPDFVALLDHQVWIAAFSQVFFSLSIAFGIMIAYASYKRKETDVVSSSYMIGIADAGIAILAGFVVFATLGFMATEQGVDFTEVVSSGPGLAFIAFPQALSLMPFATFFSILFFVTLLTLAVDSAFSLVEAINTTVLDKTKMRKQTTALIICVLGFLAGLVFTTNGGLYLLDVVDHFITNITLVVIGILQCIAVGWIYGAKKMRKFVNRVSNRSIGQWWDISIKFVIPIVLIILLGLQLRTEFLQNYGGYPDWAIVVGWLVVIIPLVVAFLLPQRKVRATA